MCLKVFVSIVIFLPTCSLLWLVLSNMYLVQIHLMQSFHKCFFSELFFLEAIAISYIEIHKNKIQITISYFQIEFHSDSSKV